MSDKDPASMTDRETVDMILASITMHRIASRDDEGYAAAFTIRAEAALKRAAEALAKHEELLTKLANVSEDLMVERMSNRRMKALLVEVWETAMPGRPDCYPEFLRGIVAKVQAEVSK